MAEQFKRLDRKLVYHGHIVDFYEDTMQVPNGNVVKWDFIKHNGAAAVVPVLDDGRILMVKQYRNALDKEIWEIPAGGLNSARVCPKRTGRRDRISLRIGRYGVFDFHCFNGCFL